MKFFQKYSQHFVQIVLSYFAFTSNTFVYTECIILHHFVDSDRTTSNMVICDSKSKTVTRCCRFLQKHPVFRSPCCHCTTCAQCMVCACAMIKQYNTGKRPTMIHVIENSRNMCAWISVCFVSSFIDIPYQCSISGCHIFFQNAFLQMILSAQ